jgi:RNA polymerase sigma factor (sigma-70 family)
VAATALQSDTPDGTDEAARLFEAHSQQLFGYCLRQLGSRSEAEDAVQTTFLYALRALRRGVVPECESAWLTTIAKNVCRWQRRTLDRRGPLSSDVELDTIALARPTGDEDGRLFGLEDALATMPERQRRALLLREWRGLPTGEVALQLGLSAPALLTRARSSLAQALTLPRRPVLGLAWLIVDLRAHVKALLGGVSAKAAAATAAVVGVGGGVGGVAVERVLADPKPSADPMPAAVQPRLDAPAAVTVAGTSATTSFTVVARGRKEADRTSPARPVTAVVPGRANPRIAPTTPLPRAADPQANPAPSPDASPPTPTPPAALPVEPPRLPEVKLPKQVIPQVDLPLLPPVELPPLPPLPPLPTEELPVPEVPLPTLPLP